MEIIFHLYIFPPFGMARDENRCSPSVIIPPRSRNSLETSVYCARLRNFTLAVGISHPLSLFGPSLNSSASVHTLSSTPSILPPFVQGTTLAVGLCWIASDVQTQLFFSFLLFFFFFILILEINEVNIKHGYPRHPFISFMFQ